MMDSMRAGTCGTLQRRLIFKMVQSTAQGGTFNLIRWVGVLGGAATRGCLGQTTQEFIPNALNSLANLVAIAAR